MNIRSRSILAAAGAAALFAAVSTASQASAPADKLELTVYLDRAGGSDALSGDFETTIQQLGARSTTFRRDFMAGSTNLCVAYTMTRRWDEARVACDDAISQASASHEDDRFQLGQAHRTHLAVAYSNRAVLNWLQHRPAKAVRDVTRAHSLAPQSQFVSKNYAILNGASDELSAPTVAAVTR